MPNHMYMQPTMVVISLGFQGAPTRDIKFYLKYQFQENVILCIWPKLLDGPSNLKVGLAYLGLGMAMPLQPTLVTMISIYTLLWVRYIIDAHM